MKRLSLDAISSDLASFLPTRLAHDSNAVGCQRLLLPSFSLVPQFVYEMAVALEELVQRETLDDEPPRFEAAILENVVHRLGEIRGVERRDYASDSRLIDVLEYAGLAHHDRQIAGHRLQR